MARLLQIVPDVEPGHATRLITAALTNHGQAEALGHVLHSLFEKPNYPKVNRSKSAKRTDRQSHGNLANVGSSSKMNFDFGYGNKSRPFRGGSDYAELALVRISCIIVVSHSTVRYAEVSAEGFSFLLGRLPKRILELA
jgi:TRIAD3 protein (E3 ubiquitin-protein ligase RNF216)